MILGHHGAEEGWYFALLNNAVPFEQIADEHARFHAPLEALGAYLMNCLPAGTVYGIYKNIVPTDSKNETLEAAKLLALIDELTIEFVPHVSC